MKYYLYISDGKIDMLWAQKPRGVLERFSASLKLDFKVLGLSLEKKPNDETLYSKLASVEESILKNFEVGTIENPKTYFTGTLPMCMRILKVMRRNKEFAYFGGELSDRYIALVGSPNHLIGSRREFEDLKVQIGSGLYSNAFSWLKQFVSEQESAINHSSLIETVNSDLKGPRLRVEFLAKRLNEGERSLVGTPLYVALAD